jgi:hypothetical protein
MFAAGLATGFAVAAGVFTAGSLGARLGFEPSPSYFFGGKMVRAEVVVKDGAGTHDYRLDRGVVRAVSSSSITLRERTGDLVTIPVSGGADVRVNGRSVSISQVRKGSSALVVRDGDQAAGWVRATPRP